MELGLTGRKALVFGSSAGLGRAVAAALVVEGAAVVVTSRDPDRAASTASDLGAVGSVTVDLTVAGEGARAVADDEQPVRELHTVVVPAHVGGARPTDRVRQWLGTRDGFVDRRAAQRSGELGEPVLGRRRAVASGALQRDDPAVTLDREEDSHP